MLKIIGAIITLIGVVFVFDARNIVKRFFSFGDQNEGSLGIKIVGFLFAIIGGLIIFFNLK